MTVNPEPATPPGPAQTSRRGINRRAGSAWGLLGFILGLLPLPGLLVDHWVYAWAAPLALAVLLVLASLIARHGSSPNASHRSEALLHAAEGALAAAIFAKVFAAAAVMWLPG